MFLCLIEAHGCTALLKLDLLDLISSSHQYTETCLEQAPCGDRLGEMATQNCEKMGKFTKNTSAQILSICLYRCLQDHLVYHDSVPRCSCRQHSIPTTKATNSTPLFFFFFWECGYGGMSGSCSIKPVSHYTLYGLVLGLMWRMSVWAPAQGETDRWGGGVGWGGVEVKGGVGLRRGQTC